MADRVLIASGNPWSFCMAVERDFARQHAEARVDVVNLFKFSARHSPHWRPRDRLIEALNRKIERFVVPSVNGRDITGDLRVDGSDIPPMPATYDALRAYELDGARIGLAVLSSVSSLTTIQFPASLDEFGPVLEPAWRSAHLSFRAGRAARERGYDQVILFNGRHCYSRPFCDVLQQDCEVIRYEQGSAGDRYISNAGSVHHPVELARMIREHPFDRAAGEAFFRARLEKQSSTEVGLMTAKQRAGVLPSAMAEGRAVAFFTSASDEVFAVTDDALYGSFATQYEIALALAGICASNGLQLVVRLHPHLRFKHPAWKREWDFAELKRRGVLVLAHDDPADSYAIVRAAHSVVTTGSTIGLEATYLGIPNAVVGTWLAGCLSASVQTDTAAELAQFVAAPRLPDGALEAALSFGAFYRKGGKALPELDVGSHPNFARIDGRIVDPIRYAAQRLRFFLRPPSGDAQALDVRSGMQKGRVLLPPGTDYSSAYGNAAMSGSTKSRRAATPNSLSGE